MRGEHFVSRLLWAADFVLGSIRRNAVGYIGKSTDLSGVTTGAGVRSFRGEQGPGPGARFGRTLEQVRAEGDGDGFGAGAGAELIENGEDVGLDGARADTELVGNFAVVQPAHDAGQHLELAGAKGD